MTDRSNQDLEYVVMPNRKPKTMAYYYDNDDDNDSQVATVTRRIVRTRPAKEQHIRYVTADELESDHRRQRVVESNDHKIKIRSTSNGEPAVLDEDGNVLKIIRNVRSPTPPLVESRRIKVRPPREHRTLYYETPDGQLVTRAPKHQVLVKPKNEYVYADDEPSRLLRKVIIDPRTGDQETIYEDKPKRQHRKKYIVRKHMTESPPESDGDYEQQPQYVQVVQRQGAPTQAVTKQEKPTTKYVMVRKKVDSEPAYALAPSMPPAKSNRRIVYEAPTKKPSTMYVYPTDGKYYK